MKKHIWILSIILLGLVSCKDDQLGESIFSTRETESSELTKELDEWLYTNYVLPYNIEFRYRWNDNASDVNYNLIPTSVSKADTIAHLARYLWFDVYDKQVGPDFLKIYGPRMIQLIGSAAINASQHTEKLGTAEGGIKITLYKVNKMDVNSIEQLNEYIFKTMHHEFSHILHQTKNYPKEYEAISAGQYDTDGWQNRNNETAWRLGFITPYGSSQPREDFVEVIANYIVKDSIWWNEALTIAEQGKPNPDADATGKDIILEKLEMCKTWLKDKYGYALDSIRNEVQRRQANLDYDMIMHDKY